MPIALSPATSLPRDSERALLIGRVWDPEVGGPTPVLVRDGAAVDVSTCAPTVSALLERDALVGRLRNVSGRAFALDRLLANTAEESRDTAEPWLLAPCDLQAIKAAGVTFVASMLERVIEEKAAGDPARARALRDKIDAILGSALSGVEPGSEQAASVKALLIEEGFWSQYLEVGIGPDPEIFTKSQPMSAVGTGATVGLHPGSVWNNPEPEVVLAVDSGGRIRGATLGNDVNLRDFEGRSALLLGKAKDNNASCAIGPFIRLFDDGFGMDEVRACTVSLTIEGAQGYRLEGSSEMRLISRDPEDLVRHAAGANHQYPDGFMLFLGTMFAPTQDRGSAGMGFTHRVGDVVSIASPALGALVNRVDRSDRAAPWTFGVGALMANLAGRHLL